MNLQMRIDLLARLGDYILSGDEEWSEAKHRASLANPWFTPEFIELAIKNIADQFLTKQHLIEWTSQYDFENVQPKKVGIVMAGNIPMVGFHDLLSVFISGHKAKIKPSSKDEILITHVVTKLEEWSERTPSGNSDISDSITFEVMLKGCDAYITTGSNNSARYFEYYFSKYPHIIRRNRTSVAILEGGETTEELERLADDVHLYFGMGCRNVTKIYVPHGYDFAPMLTIFRKYGYFKDHHKYRNNYDYNLALHILNGKFYMSNESIILMENTAVFSPISQLNYEFYADKDAVIDKLSSSDELQCIVGRGYVPFGEGQIPSLTDYADGINTLNFLINL
ncbi:MAG TPA: acyl-CoA reductase [Chitinophagaceae bacterium]|nr:acyl-CoA reductase [Chitinophagaceae bacterium]